MNRGQIVAQGLELGGNTGITSLANDFLNLFLDNLARSKDFETLITEASISGTAGSSDVDISSLATYRSILRVHLDGDDQPLKQQDYPDIWKQVRVDTAAGSTGTPEHFAIKPDSTTLVLWPIPKTQPVGKILYYRVPAAMTSDSDVPWFADAHTMVNAVADFSATYDKDPLLQVIQRNLDVALGKAVQGLDDSNRSRAQQIKFDPFTYRPWKGSDS